MSRIYLPDPILVIIGNNIKKYRKIRYTQEKLAFALGWHRTSVYRMENGLIDISAKNLVKLSKFLEIPVAKFFKGV